MLHAVVWYPQLVTAFFTRGDDAPVIVGLNEFVKLLRLELRKVEHANRRSSASKEATK